MTDQEVNVVSAMVHDQPADWLSITKADVRRFKGAFECALSHGEDLKETVGPRLKELIEKCHKEALELQQAKEVMRIPQSALTLTNGIAALNILVFLGRCNNVSVNSYPRNCGTQAERERGRSEAGSRVRAGVVRVGHSKLGLRKSNPTTCPHEPCHDQP
ncbi:MAG: hypothetical protein WCO60_19180 [Verrucomicrobiota bacterium]